MKADDVHARAIASTTSGDPEAKGTRPVRRVDRRNQLLDTSRTQSARRGRRRPAAPPMAALFARLAVSIRDERMLGAVRESMSARSEPARSIPSRRPPPADPDARRAADRGCGGCPPDAWIAARVHGHIALGVHAHRAMREVGRADPHELVVDDHHLRVDEGRHVRARDAAGYTSRRRLCASAAISCRNTPSRNAPIVFCSSQPWHSCGETTIISGPSGSRSRAASAAPACRS